MFDLSSSEDLAISIALIDAAAIEGFIEDVKINPDAKLLM